MFYLFSSMYRYLGRCVLSQKWNNFWKGHTILSFLIPNLTYVLEEKLVHPIAIKCIKIKKPFCKLITKICNFFGRNLFHASLASIGYNSVHLKVRVLTCVTVILCGWLLIKYDRLLTAQVRSNITKPSGCYQSSPHLPTYSIHC